MITIRDEHVDSRLRGVADALGRYSQEHPAARIDVYRQNCVSIRIRIVDESFQGMNKVERHELAWPYLEKLPEEILSEISILLLMTPEELPESFANYDFEHPLPTLL